MQETPERYMIKISFVAIPSNAERIKDVVANAYMLDTSGIIFADDGFVVVKDEELTDADFEADEVTFPDE